MWVWITAFCFAALIATYMLFVEPPPPHKIVIASGSQNGAYFRYAQKYAEELQKEHMSVEVRETAGSVENCACLERKSQGWQSQLFRAAWPALRIYSIFTPSGACTASPCGCSTGEISSLIASVNSRANESVSVQQAAVPMPLPGNWS